MTRYEKIILILDAAIGGSNIEIGVHKAFWRGLTRDEFIAKRIRDLDLVTEGDGNGSNLVKALRGESPFGADLPDPPAGARFSRMPAGLDPVPVADIEFIRKWIDDGCPEDPVVETSLEVNSGLVWHPTSAPIASSRTDDIWFTNPENGWAVNSNGQIIHTKDGGKTWSVQLQADVYFRCIGMANQDRGWAGSLTLPRRLYRTLDGGLHWELVTNLPDLAPSAICGMSVVSDKIVYASGTNYPNRPARMMKTRDGGLTWVAWEMKLWADLLVDCYFTSETTGWVVGGKSPTGNPSRANVKPVVLFTEDGGVTWNNRVAGLEFPSGEWGWKIFFMNDTIGFVSLENFQEGAILKTTDGGRTWIRLPVNDQQKNANLEGVGFIDEHTGWVGGWGDADFARKGSSVTTDGGTTWRDANEIGHAINRFRFFGNPVTVGYASGETVYKLEAPSKQHLLDSAFGPLGSSNRTSPIRVTAAMTLAGVSLPTGEATTGSPVRLTVFGRFGNAIRVFEDRVTDDQSLMWQPEDEDLVSSPGGFIVRVENEVGVFSYRLRVVPQVSTPPIFIPSSTNSKPASKITWIKLSGREARRELAETVALSHTSEPSPFGEGSSLPSFRELIATVGVPAIEGVTPEQELISHLKYASEIEHGLMLQYLYASFSRSDNVSSIISSIAIEEMGHLLTVQNLLLACGEQPNLVHGDWVGALDMTPFAFRLEPASSSSVAKYTVVEMPDPGSNAISDAQKETLKSILPIAMEAAGHDLLKRRVGLLYAKIYWLLRPNDDPFNPPAEEAWSDFPVAEFAADSRLRGRHISDSFLRADGRQGLQDDWARGWDTVIIRQIANRDDALRAIAEISEQGEGFGATPDGRFDRFVNAWTQLTAVGAGPSLNIAVNPWYEGSASACREGKGDQITSDLGVAFARAGDAAYEFTLVLIGLYLTLPASIDPNLRRQIAKGAVVCMTRCLTNVARNLSNIPVVHAVAPDSKFCGPTFSVDAQTEASDTKALVARGRALVTEMIMLAEEIAASPQSQPGHKTSAEQIASTGRTTFTKLLDAILAFD